MTNLLKLIIAALVVIIAIVAFSVFYFSNKDVAQEESVVEEINEEVGTTPFSSTKIIGSSVEGRDITVTTFGEADAPTHLLFVGGIHGGYEWNSSLLAYDMMTYLNNNPEKVPAGMAISVIPDLNPDGMAKAVPVEGEFSITDIPDTSVRVAAGRFNANKVDLNRNFACKWQPESSWQGNTVSAGNAAFSEPEAQALRDYVIANNPTAVVFWHSRANNVYASECENGVLPETLSLMSTYAQAAGYGEVPVFDAYPITGDAEGWLASVNIPAVTVELETADTTEWKRNLAGTLAVIGKYAN